MGFFSNLGDVFSGKNYKQNVLVNPSLIKLSKKVEDRSQSDFVELWMYSCIASMDTVVNKLLFEDIKDREGNTEMIFADGAKQPLNPFKENIGKLDEQRVFEFFKLLGGYHLAVFLENEDNLSFLKKIKLNPTKFEGEVFKIFDFTLVDEKIYQELKEKFVENPEGYFITLHKKIFERAFEMLNENNLMSSIIFTDMLTNAHIIFMQVLSEQIKEISES